MSCGVIIRGVGGFYDVMDPCGHIYRCRMRGSVRTQNLTPAVGDRVTFTNAQQGDGVVEAILPRVRYLKRPVVANATQGALVCTVRKPEVSRLNIDKMLVSYKQSALRCIIILNKCDLLSAEETDGFDRYYENCGAKIFHTSAKTGRGIEDVKKELDGNITVFGGVSGVGKSSLIRRIVPAYQADAGELSRKTQRGRHTTRRSELIPVSAASYILDTPGFSSFWLSDITADKLWEYYDDFYEYSDCRYHTCVHIHEPDCSVKLAVRQGKVGKSRYENYVALYGELKKHSSSL